MVPVKTAEMLFNSISFIFFFLPATLAGFFLIGRSSHRGAAAWLTAASLFFYGWWSPVLLALLVPSVAANYIAGLAIARSAGPMRRALLIAGVAGNLLVLGYFKYANFFLASLNAVANTGFDLGQIVLPIGISFFTFTQIAFLVDTCRGEARAYDPIHYALFVTNFPHLIAGPILHHKEIVPQFERPGMYRLDYQDVSVGLTIFCIGLFKKMVVADGVAPFVAPAFAAHDPVMFFAAWGGALAYTLQIYFDFSGYSDMAIGLARLFGVTFPLNFHSPYKAGNIVDFWRHWHMTLSRFLREYLYFPLGGNRRGRLRRYLNLMITMLLGGLWHGAAWTFVIWGGLHGLYLMIHHAWHGLRERRGLPAQASSALGRGIARAVTFLAVVVAWVFFRADSLPQAWTVLKGMTGGNGIEASAGLLTRMGAAGGWLAGHGILVPVPGGGWSLVVWLAVLLPIVWFAPNTQQIMADYRPALAVPKEVAGRFWRWFTWRPGLVWAGATACLALAAFARLRHVTEYIYFNF
jgi:alginate O-acetyltransferase complex protein AlgI